MRFQELCSLGEKLKKRDVKFGFTFVDEPTINIKIDTFGSHIEHNGKDYRISPAIAQSLKSGEITPTDLHFQTLGREKRFAYRDPNVRITSTSRPRLVAAMVETGRRDGTSGKASAQLDVQQINLHGRRVARVDIHSQARDGGYIEKYTVSNNAGAVQLAGEYAKRAGEIRPAGLLKFLFNELLSLAGIETPTGVAVHGTGRGYIPTYRGEVASYEIANKLGRQMHKIAPEVGQGDVVDAWRNQYCAPSADNNTFSYQTGGSRTDVWIAPDAPTQDSERIAELLAGGCRSFAEAEYMSAHGPVVIETHGGKLK